jgi:hypothetical protein
MKGVLGVDFFVVDVAHHHVEEGAVLKDEQVGVKDAAFVGAHAGADLALDIEDLLAGFDERLFQAVDFLRDFRVHEFALGDGGVGAAHDDDSAAANSHGDGDAAENLLTFLGRLWHEQ